MTETQDARKIASMMMAIAEPTRLRILFLLAEAPLNVGQLAKAVEIPMVNMSHHLGVMRQSGILEDEKQGRRVIYRIRPGLFTPAIDGVATEQFGTLEFGLYRIALLRNGKSKTSSARPKKGKRGADGVA